MLQNSEYILIPTRTGCYSLLTLIERSGQEDCRQDQEDHVPREPVPHLREVPSPPGKETFGLCRSIRLTTHYTCSLLLCQCVYDVSSSRTSFARGKLRLSYIYRKLGRQHEYRKKNTMEKTRFSSFSRCAYENVRAI